MSLRPPAASACQGARGQVRAIRMAPGQAGMALGVCAAAASVACALACAGAVSDQQRWHHGRGRLQPKLPGDADWESGVNSRLSDSGVGSGVGLPNPDSGKSGVGSRESKREFRSLHHGAAGALTPMGRRDRHSPFTGIPTQTTLPGRRRLRLRPRPPRPGQPLPTSDLIHAHIVSIGRKQQLSRG